MRFVIFALLALLSCSSQGQDCYRTSVTAPTPLMGNHGEVFRTAEGQTYEVVGSYEYLYAYYPTVTICPSRGKMSVEGKTIGVSLLPVRASGQTNASITVVARVRGCDYFVADGPRGYYVLEWYGGYDPDKGDLIYGDIRTYGFKDVLYARERKGRLYVEDYLLSKDNALEKLLEKCR